ncbi:bifunctional indole-3-glycerol-phosphate synthase TrpC/phosphoribosylanthranilate isomerase TrpF [Prodigiosinella confusarubida]|uniref:Multifunctional fusion protein n=1 Tax=Serratia sp. (strain ATCC 39006) TaxID=104623 RepID=A0A2I5T8B8_SERS3|nr:bifunctional indole-3-glycerol-phosphate synthase TrpC/phosphoribosylanthranilate isomerase TrpF [Serratia sp. ATCC 39006]AUH00796.1 bifunctional indole-3-glycerol-phosphate synthase TrpC/phosphoribosylanthranilate isomerase TrpF [Serratia sp. ATCC 39006]AUH05117.1 bifunctional indole-3-glycerol-phosphate synthase TrpC/phosphoribosylanthranilate isomerase TrpF [Serratia sp. ATCC 39006]
MQDTVLTKIVRDKALWIEGRRQQQPLADFQHLVKPSQRSFYQSLKRAHPAFILECKKASPSKGLIRTDFDPVAIARVYQDYASAISVLTDEKYFQGNFEFLAQVSATVPQPVLCKDFIIDPYQIYLARHYQADAILLMLSVLDDTQYRQLAAVAHSLNMGVLTEASNESELQRAIHLDAQVVGINNRDLRDLSIDLNRTRTLAPRLPASVTVISESGISRFADIQALSPFADGFLIGSSLMSEPDLALAVRRVILGENKVCGLTRPEDAAVAYQAGAVYGGLIFVESSPRYISVAQAETIITGAALRYVGVFRDATIADIVTTAEKLNLAAVQLHGHEDQHTINALRQQLPAQCKIWKALGVNTTLPGLELENVDRIVLDNTQGGSGKTFDWSLLHGHTLNHVLLAGGLSTENTAQATTFGCAGLDFNSGVESQPGIKDPQKIAAVFNILRTAQQHRAPLNQIKTGLL